MTASRVASGWITRSWSTGCSSEACSITRANQLKLTYGAATARLLHTLGVITSLYDQVWGPAAQNLVGVVYSGKP
ncbi:hypothetical protein B1R27_13445 [Streptomyces sp. GKU 895]|nr:hypothetical protein B1R27_13445 [Streptomyces sp. GKU 895]